MGRCATGRQRRFRRLGTSRTGSHCSHVTDFAKAFALPLALVLAGCGPGQPEPGTAASDSKDAPASASPSPHRQAGLTVEGRIEEGVECPVVHTPDGAIYALAPGEADFGPGDYVRIAGTLADSSFCQQGEGTIAPRTHRGRRAARARSRSGPRRRARGNRRLRRGNLGRQGNRCRLRAARFHRQAQSQRRQHHRDPRERRTRHRLCRCRRHAGAAMGRRDPAAADRDPRPRRAGGDAGAGPADRHARRAPHRRRRRGLRPMRARPSAGAVFARPGNCGSSSPRPPPGPSHG